MSDSGSKGAKGGPRPKGLNRRAFFGRSAATAVGIGMVGVGASAIATIGASAAFDSVRGFPDRPVVIRVEVPADLGFSDVEASLKITTPLGVEAVNLGRFPVRDGAVEIETALVYPYETRVAGDYRYDAHISVGGHLFQTCEPATYRVRDIVWFS